MTGHCFVVAFGYGVPIEAMESPEKVAENLRTLVDRACKAKFDLFANDCYVSVAPGGVMFAFPDDDPERAIQLCQAVAGQLEHQQKTRAMLPPVCAVITHGLMRFLDVLGFSTNFEGWPAIAAARVIATLSAGELAIEQSVWDFATLLRNCGEPTTLPGKRDGESFQVRIHQRMQFATNPSSPSQPARDKPHPPQIASDSEFTQRVKEQISTRLQAPGLQVLYDAIVRQKRGATAAEDVLVPRHSSSLIEALEHLYQATTSCLQTLPGAPAEQTVQVKAAALDIFGLVTGLAINRDNLQGSSWAFDPWQGSCAITLPLVSEAAIEVGVSSLGERSARFRRIQDPRKPRVAGKDSLIEEEVEMGLTTSDRLTGLLKRLWVAVMEVEHAPEPFRKQDEERLQAKWKTRHSLRTHCYYLTLSQENHSSQVDKVLLQRLAKVLQPLRVIYFGGAEGQGLLFVNEHALWALIEEFFDMVEHA